jgi:hypothetical protein
MSPSTLVFFRWGRRIGLDMASLYRAWTWRTTWVATRPVLQRVLDHEGTNMD